MQALSNVKVGRGVVLCKRRLGLEKRLNVEGSLLCEGEETRRCEGSRACDGAHSLVEFVNARELLEEEGLKVDDGSALEVGHFRRGLEPVVKFGVYLSG